ncbi:MAG TPA: glycoside hydrolase family 2 TIM barrel-domain containing protein, partial [Sunxiuqinia sp.]|nr:glycoside hydrolase family 2 TIM barrel-domain containing protein [Sunxiuqinia sp.]
AHYQHGQYTYNYCDTSGMILWTEVPVINKVSYSAMFTNSAKTQLRELIKQNYNHPSVFFWGLFNEINFLSGPDPAALIGDLNTIAHQLDSTRLTTAAAMLDDRATHSIPDLIAFNKYIGWYGGNYNDFDSWADNMHKNHLDFKIGLSEYGAGADTADHVENPFPPNTGSFYHPEEYQSNFHERYWKAIKQRPYIWGTALWVGFDFASDGRFEGIAPGINDKGLVTRDRKTKKDAFFFYKANWTTDPFVYISSRRYRERLDSLVEVKVYSNCDSVSIRLNDSLYPILTAVDHIFKWEQGLLKAGKNIIRTVGFKGGGSYRDSCVWYFDPSGMAHQDSIMKGDVQINFQPVSSNPPSGYLVDNGLTYGDRGNGYVYGWNADNSGNMRDRQSTSDTIFNTFDHMQKDGPDKIWEMAVSNGTYRVTIGCGDPDYTDSYHVVEVEGKVFVRGTHPAESMLIGTDTVSVNDGKITVRPSLSSVNAKLNFIHLTCLTCGATSVSNAVAGRLGILVFPNPASDRINIDLSSGFGEVSSVTVFNSNGQILKKLVPISETMPIDTGKWGKGLYLIAVLYNDGKVLTHKVVLK